MHARNGPAAQVLEEFRLPKGFDAASVRVFNTNTFLVRAEPLARRRVDWTYFEVEKKVDGKPAIQFERLLQELTAALDTVYVRVPRTETGGGVEARFLPVKDPEELERRRARNSRGHRGPFSVIQCHSWLLVRALGLGGSCSRSCSCLVTSSCRVLAR